MLGTNLRLPVLILIISLARPAHPADCSVTGKVNYAWSKDFGAPGVKIEMIAKDGSFMLTTETDNAGNFVFNGVQMTIYDLRASRPRWYISKDRLTVDASKCNLKIPDNSLVVSGFDVSGRFPIYGETNEGVVVGIFRYKLSKTRPILCQRSLPYPQSINMTDYEPQSACFTRIQQDGKFNFRGVPPGRYLLQLIQDTYDDDVQPYYMEIEVENSDIDTSEYFTGWDFKSSLGCSLENAVFPIWMAFLYAYQLNS